MPRAAQNLSTGGTYQRGVRHAYQGWLMGLMPTATVSVWTLAWADIKGLGRNNFGLGAAAVLTTLSAFVMAFTLYGPEAMRDALLFLCLVPQLAVAVILAARIASARRSRLVESLYTTPLRPQTWLAAQALVGLFLGGAIIAVHLPAIAVFTAFAGWPHMAGQVLAASAITAIASVSMGLFFGVVAGQAGPGAAASMAGGYGFLSFLGMILNGIAADPGAIGSMATLFVRACAISPLAMAVAATRMDTFSIEVAAAWHPIIGLAGFTAGLAGAAWLAYVRLQSPVGWEPRPGRWAVALLAAAALVVPIATAATEYREVEGPDSFTIEPGEHTRIAFAEPGQSIDDNAFTFRSLLDWKSLRHSEDNRLDVLVMLVAPAQTFRSVTIQVTGSDGISVTEGGQRIVHNGQPDGQARLESDGSTGPLRPVYRVPATVRPLGTSAFLESPNILDIKTAFTGDGKAYESHARMSVTSNIAGAKPAMLAAGLPAPLIALGALVARRVRTR